MHSIHDARNYRVNLIIAFFCGAFFAAALITAAWRGALSPLLLIYATGAAIYVLTRAKRPPTLAQTEPLEAPPSYTGKTEGL